MASPVTFAPLTYGPGDVANDCYSGEATFEVLFRGLAPGTVGVYQLDMQLAHLDAAPYVVLTCGVYGFYTSVTFPVQPPSQ